MRTVMAEAGTVTTTQRGPIVRRTRARYQARANPNNRKSRRHRRRRRSYFAAPIPREESKAAAKIGQVVPSVFLSDSFVNSRSNERGFRRIEFQKMKSRSRCEEKILQRNIFQ